MESLAMFLVFIFVLHVAALGLNWNVARSTTRMRAQSSSCRMGSTDDTPQSDRDRIEGVLSGAASRFISASALGAGVGLGLGLGPGIGIGSVQNLPAYAASAGAPKITDRVKLEVKIANYTEESVGTNKGATGSGNIVIGLYGEVAPEACSLFLQTVMGDGIDLPSFYNAQFQRVTPQGLLEMDKVRGVNEVNIAGSSQWEYKGKVLSDYKPIIENNGIHHDRQGLLTHKQLSSTPEFSITLKDKKELSEEDLKTLDSFHCVFGEVLEGSEVLQAISEIPLYTYQTSSGYAGGKRGAESEIADKWFAAQREFYVGVGKSFGDQRAVDMRGKLLRRTVIKNATKL